MRLSTSFAILLGLICHSAFAANVSRYECKEEGSVALCRIELDGTVSDGESLFISEVNDRDTLQFGKQVLGSTGQFYGRPFSTGFLPRLYSLQEVVGEKNPILTLNVSSDLDAKPGISPTAKIKVVDKYFPIWKVILPPLLKFLSFIFLVWLCSYQLRSLRQSPIDGWIHPANEMRWFFGSLFTYLFLKHELSHLSVPSIWSPQWHLFCERVALLIGCWAASLLIVHGRFSDRSSIERDKPRSSAKPYVRLANACLVLSLVMITSSTYFTEGSIISILVFPLLPALFSSVKSARELEWKRILKRSSTSPLLFQLSLFLLPAALLISVFSHAVGNFRFPNILEATGWIIAVTAGIRTRSMLNSKEKSLELAVLCRKELLRHTRGSDRLKALCDFVVEEWGAARISVVSVDSSQGLVLASAGPEAIPSANRAEPRKLGPFLRRVCKQGQMLYAPVAEELGKDLQEQGLKHSSLAIPLSQEKQVRAVLCMMADEGERIPPQDAVQLDLLTEALSLEILSAAAQHVAENRSQHLHSIARTANGLAVEHLDHWGYFAQHANSDSRVVIGADLYATSPFLEQLKRSPTLGRVWAAYRQELRGLWSALANSYEFLAKDNREDFWIVSPREFQNATLQNLGAERVSVLLALAIERHTRALNAKDCYLVLGYSGVRVVAGAVKLRFTGSQSSSVEIDQDQLASLVELRRRSLPSSFLFRGDPTGLNSAPLNFQCRAKHHPSEGTQIFSILYVSADKKEVRRIENQALEKARAISRKVA